jgi:hypothetical protein
VISRPACLPFAGPDGGPIVPARTCADAIAETLNALAIPTIRHVVIAARWPLYSEDMPELGDRAVRLRAAGATSADRRVAVHDAVGRFIAVARGGHRTVTLIGPVPETGVDVARRAVRAAIFGRDYDYAQPAAIVDMRFASLITMLNSFGGDVQIVYPHRALCREGRCHAVVGGIPIYSDNNHLTERGAMMLAPLLIEAFRFPAKPGPRQE